MYDLTIEKDVVAYMKESISEQDWNDHCDEVKKSWNGGYPEFWYNAVIRSGVAFETMSKWK